MRLGFMLPMLLGCLLSCGAAPPGEEGGALTEKQGSRLRRFYWAGEDGLRAFAPGTFWDSQREQRCGFQEYQGQYLCLPIPAPKIIDPADYVGGDFLHE